MATPAYIGIDIGTSSIKAVAVSAAGEVLAVADSPQTVSVPAPGWSEQDPDGWWDGTVNAVKQVVGQLESPSQVKAIGLSGQMHTLVALDSSQEVVRPAILWNDVRTSEQCDFIFNAVGPEQLMAIAGNPPLEGFTATKILWIKQHEPENYARIKTVMLAKDYVRFRMTGELASEPSDAAATLLFDIRRGNWSSEMCSKLGIDPWLLPTVNGSSEIAGRVSAAVSELINIPEGTPVVAGGADNACAAAGSGVTGAGTMLVSVGTSGTVVAPTVQPVVDEGMRIHSMNHVERDTWYLMGVVLSAGAALAWWRNSLAAGSDAASFDDLVSAAARVTPGSDGVTFLPYLTGERTPYGDANARGVFAGMDARHDRHHMTRAVLEGVTFALRDSVELMRPLGAVPDSAVIVGGGARSDTWRRIMADAIGIPLKTVGPAEGAPLGAAMLAAVGDGVFSSVAEAGEAWLSDEGVTEPNIENQPVYDDAYARYTSLYPALADWFEAAAHK